MRFFGNIWAWLLASLVAYVTGLVFATQLMASAWKDQGLEVTLGLRLGTTWDNILNMAVPGALPVSYLMVIAITLMLAFFIASLVKALIPVLSPVAYPVAGGAGLALTLYLMLLAVGFIPIPGVDSQLGFALQALAGAIGGLTFEFFRPRGKEE